MPHLVEFIGVLSRHAEQLAQHAESFPGAALEQFRSTSRQQAQSSMKRLKELERELSELPADETAEFLWDQAHDACQEILTTEMLGRVWGAILESSHHISGQLTTKSVARHVLLQHLEVRHALLSFMNRWCERAYLQIAEIDGLRRKMERWTDILLGSLLQEYPVQDYAFDPERGCEFTFAGMIANSTDKGNSPWARQLVLSGLKRAFKEPYPEPAFLGEYQEAIRSAILSCVPNTPEYQPLQGELTVAPQEPAPLLKLETIASELKQKLATSAKIGEYLRFDGQVKPTPPHWN
ncbi:MAG: hypothetical protein U0903_00390 [Planctomycetales bacterium]